MKFEELSAPDKTSVDLWPTVEPGAAAAKGGALPASISLDELMRATTSTGETTEYPAPPVYQADPAGLELNTTTDSPPGEADYAYAPGWGEQDPQALAQAAEYAGDETQTVPTEEEAPEEAAEETAVPSHRPTRRLLVMAAVGVVASLGITAALVFAMRFRSAPAESPAEIAAVPAPTPAAQVEDPVAKEPEAVPTEPAAVAEAQPGSLEDARMKVEPKLVIPDWQPPAKPIAVVSAPRNVQVPAPTPVDDVGHRSRPAPRAIAIARAPRTKTVVVSPSAPPEPAVPSEHPLAPPSLHATGGESLDDRLSTGDPLALFNVGARLQKEGAWLEAAESYRRALAKDPSLIEAHNNLGVIHNRVGDTVRAEQAFRAAIGLNSRYGPAYGNLGRLLAQQGRSSEAEKILRRAAELMPYNASVQNNLALLYKSLGRDEDEANAWRAALAVGGDDPVMHFNLALHHDARANNDDALKHYSRALAAPGRLTPAQRQAAQQAIARLRR